ncbi:MAG: DNA mismatch repair protein MutS [Candidatus Margulisbacteria bacterium]|nr:DNA mismatch repair protein MutS [Candidatus Margulisiibacteriota bacterium]
MMQQYQEIKSKYDDCLLLFRLGDFYEMFFEDSYKASRILGLTLTGRGKDEYGNKIPMCGIPYHALNNYLPKLLKNNIKVAICEQTEEATQGKGITKREVVDVISPGTIIEEHLLSSTDNNFLAAIDVNALKEVYSIAYCDVSTGEFSFTETRSEELFLNEIERISPRELLVPTTIDPLKYKENNYVTTTESLSLEASIEICKEVYKIFSLEPLGLNEHPSATHSVATILNYLLKSKKSASSIQKPKVYSLENTLFLNGITLNNLEIVQSIQNKDKKGSLYWVMDNTKTAMGARCLKKWLIRPLSNLEEIQKRADITEFFYNDFKALNETRNYLDSIYDIERLTTKIANHKSNPKDLIAFKNSLNVLPNMIATLTSIQEDLADYILFPQDWINDTNEMAKLIEKTIVEDPPAVIQNGGFIKQGCSEDLDVIREEVRNNKTWFLNYENKLKEETGIRTLKIKYTRAFGYYLDVTKSNLHLIPENFIRKQTLVNSERYYTQELKEKEEFILHADEMMLRKETEIFDEVIASIEKYQIMLTVIAEKIAKIDCLSCFAITAKENNYCKPTFNDEGRIKISESRHPVIEQSSAGFTFTPNDVLIEQDNKPFILLTGPNMAGKSTYMRQIALNLIMAQTGSFIPAKKADICLTDKIFARIGASDNLFEGKSTFMVEMLETANILNSATSKSFIILDEIGRGTSTYDGLSIAASIAKFLILETKAKTVFATHYHEMTSLAEKYKEIKNLNVAVLEENGTIRFSYKVVAGYAEKSYGIHVAQLAGLPEKVIDDANNILTHLEAEEMSLTKSKKKIIEQLSLFN